MSDLANLKIIASQFGSTLRDVRDDLAKRIEVVEPLTEKVAKIEQRLDAPLSEADIDIVRKAARDGIEKSFPGYRRLGKRERQEKRQTP
jgi:hypothetical protein